MLSSNFQRSLALEPLEELTTAIAIAINNFGLFKSTANFIVDSHVQKYLIDKILRKAEHQIAFKIVDYQSELRKLQLKSCINIILIKNVQAVMNFSEKLSDENSDVSGFFLAIVFNELDLVETKTLFEILWKARIINFSIIHKKQEATLITTFTPFTEHSCGDDLSLSTKNLTSRILEIFPNKFSNMKNCSVKVTTFRMPPAVSWEGSELVGRDISLIETLSRAINFHLEVDFLEGFAWGAMHENGTGTGAIGKLLNKETDIIIGDYFLKLERLNYFDRSRAYFEAKLGFIIPRPAKLTSFEKLLQPFQPHVWLAFGSFCSIGILVMFFLPKRVKQLFYGIEIKSPLTNMILVILGISQPVVPSNGLARFILMLFIIFNLVMRSIYQGSLFKFLQTDGSHKQVKSVDEMIAKNFKFYIGQSHQSMIDEDSNLFKR